MEVTIEDIQDGVVIQDSYFRSGVPDGNYGSASSLVLADSDYYRAIIKVDLSAYAGMIPTYAKFAVYAFGDSSDINWYRVKRGWEESQVTWNSYTTGNSWTGAGCEHEDDREQTSQNALPKTSVDFGYNDFICLSESVALDIGSYFSIIVIDETSLSEILFKSTESSSGRPQFYMEYTEAALVVPSVSSDISRKDRKMLSASDDITYVAPEAADADTRYEVASEKVEEESNINHYLSQYKKIIETSDQVAEILDERCKGFTFKFEPKKMPALAQAIRKVFGKDTNEITYEMYKQVLEEQMILNEKIGDEIFAQ